MRIILHLTNSTGRLNAPADNFVLEKKVVAIGWNDGQIFLERRGDAWLIHW